MRIVASNPSFISVAVLAIALQTAVAAADDYAFFRDRVEPLLQEHCYKCHSHAAGKAKGGLVLDSKAGWMTGGDSGPTIIPGDPANSILYQAVSYEDSFLEMPEKGKLPDVDIAVFWNWIEQGAHDPRESFQLTEEETTQVPAEELWSFQPIKKVEIPDSYAGNPIDYFIERKLEEAGLPAASEAEPSVLLRRLYLELAGLPPDAEARESFRQASEDDFAAAYENVVDALLDAPEFGERWGRHWLDLAAYADTIGIGRSIPALEAWRYRDYVIDAFNSDKPLPEFVRQQIAGDIQIPPAPETPGTPAPTAEDIIATGFLAIGPWELVSGDKKQLRMDVVDKQLARVGKAFMGMTMDCARCHDHKFDPISHEDYFAMAGFFQSTMTLNGRINGVFSAINHETLPETAEELVERAMEVRRIESELASVEQSRADSQKDVKWLKEQIALLEKELGLVASNQGDIVEDPSLTELEKRLAEAEEAVKSAAARARVLEYLKPHRTQAMAMAVRDLPEPEDSHINVRGNAHQLGNQVPRGFLSKIPVDVGYLSRGTSGRVELAKWIAHEENPLTARVWVNRIWHQLFGAGLVQTVDNFGSRGEAPSHPELLDYLAMRFIEEGWSTKKLIRTILMSDTWQQASTNRKALAKAETIDPDNRLLWRANRKRLEAEAIRDSMLSVSGLLDPTRGGLTLPVDVEGNLNPGGTGMLADNIKIPDTIRHRRSVYLPQKRKRPFDEIDFVAAFDLPDTNQETGRRTLTAVPAQSLYLINSPFVQECADALAERVTADDRKARIEALYQTVYGRSPDKREMALALDFIGDLSDGLDEAKQQEVWSRLAQSLLVSNEFIFRS